MARLQKVQILVLPVPVQQHQASNLTLKLDGATQTQSLARRSLPDPGDGLAREIQQNKRLTRKVDNLRREELKRAARYEMTLTPDGNVSRKLKSIFRKTRSWLESWALQDLGAESLKNLEAAVRTRAQNDSTCLMSERALCALQSGQLPPEEVFNMVINMTIMEKTFLRPFAYLTTNEQETDIEDALKWTVELASRDSSNGGNSLRAAIIRALDAPHWPQDQEISPRSRSTNMKEYRSTYCVARTNDFLARHRHFLRKESDKKSENLRHKELLSIFVSAMELSSTLAAENPKIKIHFLANMLDARYTTQHKSLRPSDALNLATSEQDDDGLDPWAIGLEGQPIDMVIEPLVTREGDAGGENYNLSTVLHKAMVWMVKDDDLTEADRVRLQQRSEPQTAADVVLTDTYRNPDSAQRQHNLRKRKYSSDAAPAASRDDGAAVAGKYSRHGTPSSVPNRLQGNYTVYTSARPDSAPPSSPVASTRSTLGSGRDLPNSNMVIDQSLRLSMSMWHEISKNIAKDEEEDPDWLPQKKQRRDEFN
ncbi:hypothetical protein HRR80_006042 [Exophiala dermatitidis]|nr:hypothetical protein HRR74_007883 [Exophiala dermatitidis]KAJ4535564.1 hypothetical protein HRR77_007883 [Exophiala dermatitidis]KAJ4544488.1 hypothetical protein HRR76_002547 [Exophiala dermatitidis]KAJ4602310.1 hypothetical protein HRR84_002067 [Exophiala dermatitidis]KAJ4606485.1 hypothetical protein HRR85_007560 [Exophiala dermatitidis]